MRKKGKLAIMTTRCHSLSFVVIRCTLLSFADTRCHSLSFVVTRCTSNSLVLIQCHLLPFVVTRCITRCYSLSLDVSLVCLFINDPQLETKVSETKHLYSV